MAGVSGQELRPEGWYPDPFAQRTDQERWWDGVQWLEFTRETRRMPAARPPRARRPEVENWPFLALLLWPTWVVILGSLVQWGLALGFRFGHPESVLGAIAIGLVTVLVVILLALRDRRVQLATGATRPASAWWVLLTPVAYVIARIVAQRRDGVFGARGPLIALGAQLALLSLTVLYPALLSLVQIVLPAAIFGRPTP